MNDIKPYRIKISLWDLRHKAASLFDELLNSDLLKKFANDVKIGRNPNSVYIVFFDALLSNSIKACGGFSNTSNWWQNSEKNKRKYIKVRDELLEDITMKNKIDDKLKVFLGAQNG